MNEITTGDRATAADIFRAARLSADGFTLIYTADGWQVSTADCLLLAPLVDDADLDPATDRVWRGKALRPCGTHAAFNRHKARGERPCELCRKAETTYSRELQRRRRATRRAADTTDVLCTPTGGPLLVAVDGQRPDAEVPADEARTA